MKITRDEIYQALIKHWGLDESCSSEEERSECMHELIYESHDIIGEIVQSLNDINNLVTN